MDKPASICASLSATTTMGLIAGFVIRDVLRLAGASPGVLAVAVATIAGAWSIILFVSTRTIPRITIRLAIGTIATLILVFPEILARVVILIGSALGLGQERIMAWMALPMLLVVICASLPVAPSLGSLGAAQVLAGLAAFLFSFLVPVPVLLLSVVAGSGLALGFKPVTGGEGSGLGSAWESAFSFGLFGLSTGVVVFAQRASLDPTPSAFLVALCSAVLIFMLLRIVPLPWRDASGWAVAPPILGLLVAAVIPGAWLRFCAPRVSSWVSEPTQVGLLPLLMVACAALPALPAGLFSVRPDRSGRIHENRQDLAPGLLAGGIGLAVAAWLGSRGPWMLPLVGSLVGLVFLVMGGKPVRRLMGLALAVIAGGVYAWLPPQDAASLTVGWPGRLGPTHMRHQAERAIAGSQVLESDWGPAGAWSLSKVDGALIQYLDGAPGARSGREANAWRLGAHLGAILAENKGHMLVLGDERALVVPELLLYKPGVVESAIPRPAALRALSRADARVAPPLLSPAVIFRGVPSRWILQQPTLVDLIVHVAPRSWMDAGAEVPNRELLRRARARLLPGGVYVCVLSLEDWAIPELDALVHDLAQSFPSATVWLPAEGMDQIILVGRNEEGPLPFERVRERYPDRALVLADLQVASLEDLLERAVLSAADMPAGHSRAVIRLPSSMGPVPRPWLVAHLATLADPVALWGLNAAGVEGVDLTSLRARREATRSFLGLMVDLEQGRPDAFFDKVQSLRSIEGGERALQALVDPHIIAATKAMDEGRKAGPLSPAWGIASNELATARFLDPSSDKVDMLLAEVLEIQGNVVPAEDALRRVLARRPDDLEALFGIARLRTRQGDRATALEMLRRATVAHPRSWTAWQNLGVLRMGQGDLEEARECLERASELAGPQESAPDAALAELHLASGNAAAALVTAERAIRLAPTAYHFFLRGRAWYDMKNPQKAEADFRRSILADGSYWPAQGGLGLVLAEKGDFEGASAAFQEVLARDPGNVAARLNLQELTKELEKKAP